MNSPKKENKKRSFHLIQSSPNHLSHSQSPTESSLDHSLVPLNIPLHCLHLKNTAILVCGSFSPSSFLSSHFTSPSSSLFPEKITTERNQIAYFALSFPSLLTRIPRIAVCYTFITPSSSSCVCQ